MVDIVFPFRKMSTKANQAQVRLGDGHVDRPFVDIQPDKHVTVPWMKEMDSAFHFGPARSGEQTVYGARMPDVSPNSIVEWANFIRSRGVTRVCCLLDDDQLAGFPVGLEAEYKKLFGAARILMEPVADHHLCSGEALTGTILPFLRTADTDGERAVIHCWGGNGRTGHVLAAWLVAARGLSPMAAIEAVEATGRLPREAVLAGNATLDELIELLTSCKPGRAA